MTKSVMVAIGVTIHGTGGMMDHLDRISLVVWTGFLDDCLYNRDGKHEKDQLFEQRGS
jgi:hypothetical protein